MKYHEKIKNFIKENLLPRSRSEAVRESVKWLCFVIMIMMLLQTTLIFKDGFETGYAFCIGNTSNNIMIITKNMTFNYSINMTQEELTENTISNEK